MSELLQLSDPAYQPSEEEAAHFPVRSEEEMRAIHSRLDTNADHKLDQHELLVRRWRWRRARKGSNMFQAIVLTWLTNCNQLFQLCLSIHTFVKLYRIL